MSRSQSSRGFFKVPRGLHAQFPTETFTEYEAWLYLVEHARGVPKPADSLDRGQFRFSHSYLARAWCWNEEHVRRFIRSRLTASPSDPTHLTLVRAGAGRDSSIYEVTNFDLYNGKNTPRLKPAPVVDRHPRRHPRRHPQTRASRGSDAIGDTLGDTLGDTNKRMYREREESVPPQSAASKIEAFLTSSSSFKKEPKSQKPDDVKQHTEKTSNQWALEVIAEYDVSPELAHAAADIGIARHYGVSQKRDPIRSVQFFAEIVEDLKSKGPLPRGYPEYLHRKAIEARELCRSP